MLGACAMIVTISTSGGIGGFGLGRTARLDLDALPEPLRAEACERLDPASLSALPVGRAGGADRLTYHVTVQGPEGAPARFDLPEAGLPPETLDVIDDLLARGG